MEKNDFIKSKVKTIVAEIVGIEEYNDLDSLTDDLGYDSIDFMQLRSNLSNEFDIEITTQDWFNFINEIQLEGAGEITLERINEWENKLSEYHIEVTSELIETIKHLSLKQDLDSLSARIVSLINVNTITILLIKLINK
ncbi:acyl carrier protein [Bacteroides sp.]|jgi:phosphopantetheine attachment domain protein|uniref:acyl carrier protein n=1 Tax=Bacteroides sp. TaxID=29523 RepID=UPI002626DEC7|nr:phosphopantetheine-binding protein [Bacteroides sp.]MDD3038026.1 phosphopantetheine-binding protein [Bacteroides sp.]